MLVISNKATKTVNMFILDELNILEKFIRPNIKTHPYIRPKIANVFRIVLVDSPLGLKAIPKNLCE